MSARKSLRNASSRTPDADTTMSSERPESAPLLQPDTPKQSHVKSRPLNWLRHIWCTYLRVELENTQSVARDHLANERTYLAWLRTSLSFASAGVAVTQLLRLDTSKNRSDEAQRKLQQLRRIGKPAGATLIAIAMLVIAGGALRYFAVQQALQRNRFPVSRLLVGLLSGLALGFLTLSFLTMIFLNPSAIK